MAHSEDVEEGVSGADIGEGLEEGDGVQIKNEEESVVGVFSK